MCRGKKGGGVGVFGEFVCVFDYGLEFIGFCYIWIWVKNLSGREVVVVVGWILCDFFF